jgi:hypothetical protein
LCPGWAPLRRLPGKVTFTSSSSVSVSSSSVSCSSSPEELSADFSLFEDVEECSLSPE